MAEPEKVTAASRQSAQEITNKFQSAISQWRIVDFTTLVARLDSTASDIVSYQRDSTVQRKDLAQKTKDFRKLDDAAKLIAYKSLLKAYQSFIDLLTNHSKTINSTFLQTYTPLSDAPDPYPLLETAVDAMVVAEETLPSLSGENQRLQDTVASLTTQLQDTEAKWQADRTARAQLEERLESRVREVEASWLAVSDEKKDNWEAKEKALEDKIEHQDRLLNEIKASYEVNQRLGKTLDAHGPGAAHVTSALLDMVHSDLERTSARLAEVEARNEQMRLELAQARSQASQQPERCAEDDPVYMRVRSENSALMRKLDAARAEKETLRRDLDARLRGLEREAGLLRQERDTLKAKLQRWNDYEDVKQELEVLKSIEFSTGDDDEPLAPDEDDGTTSKGAKETLEMLLLARNKKLGDELTVLRVSHQVLNKKLADMGQELSRSNADLAKFQGLVERLEDELSTVQAETPNAFPSGASVPGTYVGRYAPSAAPRRRSGAARTSPALSIISGFGPRDGGDSPSAAGGSGIFPMITAQRDRFKKRNAQLEHELSQSHKMVSQLRQEVAALQKDNLNLYEKTHYVSSYNRSAAGGGAATTTSNKAAGAASSSHAYGFNPNPAADGDGGRAFSSASGPLDRYRVAYESSLSPFAAFRGRESARAYKRMSIPERAVYSATRLVLANRASRNLFAAYCVALHVLVFFALFWLGTVDMHRHASGFMQGVVKSAAVGAGTGPRNQARGLVGGTGQWTEQGLNR